MTGRQNIFNLLSVSSIVPPSMRTDLIEFLIAHRQHILSPSKSNDAFKSRFSGRSLISDVYQRLTLSGQDKLYSLIRLPPKTAALNEVIDMTFVPFDILQIKDANTTTLKSLSMIPELYDKIVINITDIANANGELSDITQFQYRVVRDFLSRSYYASHGNIWISSTLVRYVAKVYSMTIGGRLSNLFNLSPIMKNFIQTLFCLFFIGKMTSPSLAQDFVRSHARNLGLFDSQDLLQIFSFVEDTIGKKSPESLEDIFSVIDSYGHSQIKTPTGSRINRAVLNSKFHTLHPEGRVSTIALEYPPYFLFLIILALSGNRMNLSFTMKQMNFMNEGSEVIKQMMASTSFTSV